MDHLFPILIVLIGVQGFSLAQNPPANFTPTGKYDLSPQDIVDLCTVVDGQPPPIGTDCVYMKWTPCDGEPEDNSRPCGWYKQTRCEDGSASGRSVQKQGRMAFMAGKSPKRRGKRSDDSDSSQPQRNIVPRMSFPNK